MNDILRSGLPIAAFASGSDRAAVELETFRTEPGCLIVIAELNVLDLSV